MSTWLKVLLIVLGALLVAAMIWALVRWRRKRAQEAEIADDGPSISSRLRATWTGFYANLPAHAEHFPTFVVLGDTGSGKSTVIDNHVDWRGQAHEYAPSVDSDGLLQLYLGPDLVAHELSSALLRDDSQATKRALRQLWREMGSTATVVLVLDATTLLDMDRPARREIAQRVRGKINLFPRQVREQVEVRLYLSKLDRVPGYLNFVATLGINYPAIGLTNADGSLIAADEILRAFDDHLSHALVRPGGVEFDRLISFYDRLPELVEALEPILTVLEGKDELFGARYGAGALHLGSQVPHSQVGDPFLVDREQIESSITRQERVNRRRAAGLATLLFGGVTALTMWHHANVDAAEQAVEAFARSHDDSSDASEREYEAATDVAEALQRKKSSEWLWMRWAFLPDKKQIDIDFEYVIYTHYLEPQFDTKSRIDLIYLTSLIFAARDTELGQLIIEHRYKWAQALGLEAWVIETYIESSGSHRREQIRALPEDMDNPGREWIRYLRKLDGWIEEQQWSEERFAEIRANLPQLHSPQEYELLDTVRGLMREEPNLPNDVVQMLRVPIDPWQAGEYEQLSALHELLAPLSLKTPNTSTWGLAKLVHRMTQVQGPSTAAGFEHVVLHEEGKPDSAAVEIDSAELDAVIVRSVRHTMIASVLDRIDRRGLWGGTEFFDSDNEAADQGAISGYGGGPRERIEGIYTKPSFEREVSNTLNFANAVLYENNAALLEPAAAPNDDVAAADADPAAGANAAPEVQVEPFELDEDDRRNLDRAIRAAAAAYAVSYQQALLNYYNSFEFDPGSEIALPHAIKPFAQTSSWFTNFLLTLSRNVALEFPEADPGGYFADQRAALEPFGPLATLLAEDAGQIPGLAPYQALIAALQKEVAGAVGDTGDPEASELLGRLSTLGEFALGVETGINQNYEELIADWLFGAGIDPEWYTPFLAPVREVERYGLLDVTAKVATAWTTDVRPLALPLLRLYPFNPDAKVDVRPDDLEQVFRMQGEIPGEFWEAFNRLIRPALQTNKIAMIQGVRAPGGMLAMARDLEFMSNSLWNEKGERIELSVQIELALLPMEPFEQRHAAIASVSTGGGSVYGFNQKADAQTLRYMWWEQGLSAVTLTMKMPGIDEADPNASVRYRLTQDGDFSFFRLLDEGRGVSISTSNTTLTQIAMYRGTRCDSQGPQRTRRTKLAWPVPLGRYGAAKLDVTVTLVDDPWEPFAVRSCQ